MIETYNRVMNTTYADSGVDIEKGDEASSTAYSHALNTFSSRSGMIGEPVKLEGGYSGLMDFGDFYLVQNDDGVGSKSEVAIRVGKYDTLGYDLLAMVSDDAVCVGAETVSINNTIDTEKVDNDITDKLLGGLSNACSEQKIIISGGEIAELPGLVNGFTWNSSAVGIVAKDKVLTNEKIAVGDSVVTLKSGVVRSNGLSLVRKILKDQFGENWHTAEWKDGTTWGETILTPSVIYANAVLDMIGRYGQESKAQVHGVSHITGGGMHNPRRILKRNNLGVNLDNLWAPHEAVLDLMKLGNVSDEEAYKVWNMGNGMMVITPEPDKVIEIAKANGIEAQIAGSVIKEPEIRFVSQALGNDVIVF